MTKKGIGYLVAAPILILIAGFVFLSTQTPTDAPAVFEDNTRSESDGRSGSRNAGDNRNTQQAQGQQPRAESTPAESEQAAADAVPVHTTEEAPIIGQFMRVREIRETTEDSAAGAIRNMKFVFRPGIRPHMLFEGNDQIILRYEQLARNMVGSGAKTAFFYYEVVNQDTNGDGILSRDDKFNVAISRPTGGNYRVLAYNVDKVIEYEDLPVENALRLVVETHGKRVERSYSLEGM